MTGLPKWKLYLRTQNGELPVKTLILEYQGSEADVEIICRAFCKIFSRTYNGIPSIIARDQTSPHIIVVEPYAKQKVLVMHERDGVRKGVVRRMLGPSTIHGQFAYRRDPRALWRRGKNGGRGNSSDDSSEGKPAKTRKAKET